MISKKDYILVREDEKSNPRLVRVTAVKGTSIHGRLEIIPHLKPVPVEVEEKQVLLNLGPKPHPGMVFGCDTTCLYQKTMEVEGIGDVHFFINPGEEHIKQLREAAKNVLGYLKALKLDFLLEDRISWEVVDKKTAGKWSGMYMSPKENNDLPPRIKITLDESVLSKSSIDSYEYVIAHELGHHVHLAWLRQNPKADAAWIRMYSDTVRPEVTSSTLVKQLRDAYMSSGVPLKDFRSSLEESDQEVLKNILGVIKRTSGLTSREIDILTLDESNEEGREIVKASWKATSIVTSKLSPILTEYALKNYKELLAETFAFYVLKKKFPKELHDLMEKSISFVRKQASLGPMT